MKLGTVINIVLHTVLAVAIIIVFLPALKTGNDGYQGAKVATPQKTIEVESTLTITGVADEEKTTMSEPVISAENEDESTLYNVVDGNKLDENSYAGFKLYRNWCARCHGAYGQGMAGPNLADSLKAISEREFFKVVENGKSGRIGSMPLWKTNVKVMAGRDQLYAYLMARSDGAIGEVKPQKQ